MPLLWKVMLYSWIGRTLFPKINCRTLWEIHHLLDIPCRVKNRKMICCLFMWMKKESHIRLPERLIMWLVGISKQRNSCKIQESERLLYRLILLRKVNKWQVCGNRYISVLVFILILLTELLFGIVKQI